MSLPRYRLFVIVLGLLGVLLPGSVSAQQLSDWLQFRGPGGQGISADKGVPLTWSDRENIVWKIEPPGAGTSSPIIVGSRIFLTTYTGYNVPGQAGGSQDNLVLHMVCLNRDDGKVVWTKDIKPNLPEQDKIREGHGYASSTPASDGQRVYAFFGKSGAVAFDLDGKQLWRTEVGSGLNGWGSATSPVLFKNLVIVNASVESASLVALDRLTGKEVWRARGIKESWNAPILVSLPGGKTELVVAIMGKILGFDPTTGVQLWECATDIAWYMVPGLVEDKGIIYCVGGRSGGGLAVKAGGKGDVTRTHRLWTIRKGSNVTSPIFHEGHLYWMHEGLGIAFCADAKTGTLVYEQRVERADQVYASAVMADGKIYYVTRSGKTFVVAAKPEYQLLATNTLSDRSTFNASPAIAGGRLYLRSDRYLYCLGSK